MKAENSKGGTYQEGIQGDLSPSALYFNCTTEAWGRPGILYKLADNTEVGNLGAKSRLIASQRNIRRRDDSSAEVVLDGQIVLARDRLGFSVRHLMTGVAGHYCTLK